MNSNANTNNVTHLLIGLTGGIGSGKSTVAAIFEQLGARVIDTDVISRELTQSGGEAILPIRDAFGAGLIDAQGALDRNKMRELVFSNPSAKKQLETILHPTILQQAKQLSASKTLAPYTLIVIPLLFETQSYLEWLHRTLAVDCPEEVQIARTMQRSGLDQTFVQNIIAQQIPRNQRVALADDIILNDSDLPALSIQVEIFHRRYLTIAEGSH